MNFESVGTYSEVKSMVTRLIDTFKGRQITAMFTSLTSGDSGPGTRRSRVLFANGFVASFAQSGIERRAQPRALRFEIARDGAFQPDSGVYPDQTMGWSWSMSTLGRLAGSHGSARVAQEAKDRAEAAQRKRQLERKNFELKHKREQLEAQISRMRSEFET